MRRQTQTSQRVRVAFVAWVVLASTPLAAGNECDLDISKACDLSDDPSKRDSCYLCPEEATSCCKCLSYDLLQSGECSSMVWWTITTTSSTSFRSTSFYSSPSSSSSSSGTRATRATSGASQALKLDAAGLEFDKDKCNTAADVIIIVDTSSSITEFSDLPLEQEKTFALELSDAMRNMFNGVHLGVIGFGPVKEYLPLGNTSMQGVEDAIKKIKPGTPTTPTKDALLLAAQMFEQKGRKNVEHIVFIITDGEPYPYYGASDREMYDYYFETMEVAENMKSDGVQIVTIGVGLETETGLDLMRSMASTPTENFAHPDISGFGSMLEALPEIVLASCYYVTEVSPKCGPKGTWVNVTGYNLFDTGKLACRFQFGEERFLVPAVSVNNNLLTCQVPYLPDHLLGVIGNLEVSIDQLTFTNNSQRFEFKSASDESPCFASLLAGAVPVAEEGSYDWLWILLLIPLLLLACLYWLFRKRREAKGQRVPIEEPTKAVVGPPAAPAFNEPLNTEPAAPVAAVEPQGRFKWLVTPSAYIGFGKAKMDVDWNGSAPASAPHAVVRKQSMEDLGEQDIVGHKDIENNAGSLFVKQESPASQRCLPWAAFCCWRGPNASKTTSNKNKGVKVPSETRKTSLSSVQLHLPPRLDLLPNQHQSASSVLSAGKGSFPSQASSSYDSTGQVKVAVRPLPLPPGWEALQAEDGNVYYENRDLQVTQWQKP